MAVAKKSLKSSFSVFKNRNFKLLFWAMFVSEFGTGLTAITSSILIYRETGSAFSVGLMLMVTALPGLLLGLIAGVFVDRTSRKRVLIITELVSALAILLIPFMLRQYGIVWLYILVALKSTAYQFFAPALNAILPDVTTDDELAAANSLLSTSHIGAMGLGFTVAGYIAARFNIDLAFYLDAASYLVSTVFIAFLVVPKRPKNLDTSIATVLTNLREGITYIRNASILSSIIWVTFLIYIILGFWYSAMLPFAVQALGATEFEYSLIEGIGLVGFVLGGLTMTVLIDRLREGQWIVIGLTAMGFLGMLYSQLDILELAILVNLFVSFFDVPSFIVLQLITQRNTTTEVRGRVSAVRFVVRDLAFVLGMLLVGIIDIYPIRDVMLYMSMGLALIGISSIFFPGLRRSRSEWVHSLELLRGISEAPGLDTGRSVTVSDFDRMMKLFPALEALGAQQLHDIMSDITYTEAPQGTLIIRQGETNDNAYFILEGRVVVGHIKEDGSERVLATLNAGDYFGEFAALKHVPRTANILSKSDVVLLRVPDHTLLNIADNPTLNRLLFSTMTTRQAGLNMIDTPHKSGQNQNTMMDLRTSSKSES